MVTKRSEFLITFPVRCDACQRKGNLPQPNSLFAEIHAKI